MPDPNRFGGEVRSPPAGRCGVDRHPGRRGHRGPRHRRAGHGPVRCAPGCRTGPPASWPCTCWTPWSRSRARPSRGTFEPVRTTFPVPGDAAGRLGSARPHAAATTGGHVERATAGRGHGRLRVHGRGPLAGLAHRPARVRPALQPGAWPCCAAGTGGRGRAAARALRLGRARQTDWRDLLGPRRRAAHRRVHAGGLARRDRHRRAGRGQARAVREADGQHRGRGRGHGRGGGAGPRPRRPLDDRLQLPAGAGHRAGPPAGGRGPDRPSATCGPATCRTGWWTRRSR